MNQRFVVKRLPDGRAMLNLGCGTRMHHGFNNLDFSPYVFFANHRGLANILYKIKIISEDRWMNILKIDPDIISWNILKGVSFLDNTFNVIYSSHVIEHLDKDFSVPFVLKECYRTLREGGIIRIVVPDLYDIISRYLKAFQQLEIENEKDLPAYDKKRVII